MALTQVYTAIPNDVITAARWNNEFGNIYNNGTLIAFPLTLDVSFAGKIITLDSAGSTTMVSSGSTGLSFAPGTKSGTPNTTGKTINIAANTFTDTNTAGSGTATAYAAMAIQQPTLAATNATVATTDAATLYIAAAPANGTNETITNPWAIWVDAGNVRFDGGLTVGAITSTSSLHVGSSLFGKPIGGLIISNDAGDVTNDIAVSVGEASSDDATLSARRLMVLSSSIIKRLDASWSVGTNAGGLDTGSIGDSEYYVFLIQRADTGVVDVLFSLSSTAPTMPANYAFKRLIGWIKRVSAALLLFTAKETPGGGVKIRWSVPTLDIDSAATLTTSRLSSPLKVPLNISTLAHITVAIDDASLLNVRISCPDETDAAPSTTAAPLVNVRSHVAGVPAVADLYVQTSVTGTVAARAVANTMDQYRVMTVDFEMSRR